MAQAEHRKPTLSAKDAAHLGHAERRLHRRSVASFCQLCWLSEKVAPPWHRCHWWHMDEHQHEHQCSSQTFLPDGAPHPIGLITLVAVVLECTQRGQWRNFGFFWEEKKKNMLALGPGKVMTIDCQTHTW